MGYHLFLSYLEELFCLCIGENPNLIYQFFSDIQRNKIYVRWVMYLTVGKKRVVLMLFMALNHNKALADCHISPWWDFSYSCWDTNTYQKVGQINGSTSYKRFETSKKGWRNFKGQLYRILVHIWSTDIPHFLPIGMRANMWRIT